MTELRAIEDMSSIDPEKETAVLWAMNRFIFHPRGFAMTFSVDEEKKVDGWYLQGNGTEVWAFDSESDDDGFAKFEAFLNMHRERGPNEQ